jgi:hypothetical protein
VGIGHGGTPCNLDHRDLLRLPVSIVADHQTEGSVFRASGLRLTSRRLRIGCHRHAGAACAVWIRAAVEFVVRGGEDRAATSHAAAVRGRSAGRLRRRPRGIDARPSSFLAAACRMARAALRDCRGPAECGGTDGTARGSHSGRCRAACPGAVDDASADRSGSSC